jgi:hypothetical protein
MWRAARAHIVLGMNLEETQRRSVAEDFPDMFGLETNSAAVGKARSNSW